MTLRVAVDFGTSSTCVVASLNGRDAQVVVVDGQPLMSSAVYAAADGTLFVGQEAERQAAMDPSRYEPNPKRRIDEGELLLGDTVLRVTDVVRAVLSRAVSEARRLAGGAEVSLLVLTHPADWGAVRTRLLRQAAGGLAHQVALVPEPVAAAVYHAATFAPTEVNQERTVEFSGAPGDTLAVLDLGGGTVDVSVVRRASGTSRGGFQVLATRGDPSFGGADIDQSLLEHVGSLVSATDPGAWSQLVDGRELADRRRRRVLHQDVRGAKETLSRHAYTDVPMPPPFADAHVTREDLERLIAAPLGRAVELTVSAIDEAGMRPRQLTAIFLVGGSSRVPMISRLVHERTGVVPTTLDQPETVVARGALRAVQLDPAHPAPAHPAPARGTPPRGTAPPGSNPDRPTTVVRPTDPPPPARPAFSGLNVARQRPVGRPLVPLPPPHPVAPAQAPEPPKPTRRKRWWLIGAAALVVAAAAVTVPIVLSKSGDSSQAQGRQVAQYHYQFVAPSDWAQTDDNVQIRQSVLKPADAQQADDLVAVQEFLLVSDATANRAQFVDQLRAGIAQKPQYSQFNPDASYAGKAVMYYRETKPRAVTDWYVLPKGTVQVSIGCQYAGVVPRERVASACEEIVRTLEITS
ncbi:type VII secretion-associated protein [Amycolatopsis sp. CA-230715]|uniref:type VII secretion-associated protein n=1 Tax=Amycolatopsis sp. CA-230715 TaxID=2745196 RepID=UPI001C326BA3|nr:type VII secretion-associated protein [Amycolatopsis sp. CA-230715]QWF79626.1 Chaperone protein DnaK [Amycolatopsis sp. CA-230715]